MTNCPDCGTRLIRLADRLYQCPISALYYVGTYGKLSPPLIQPPEWMIEAVEEEKEPPKQKTIARPNLPKALQTELTERIGEDNIPLFLRFLTEVVRMRPVQFVMQPRDIREIIEGQSFPKWLEKHEITPAQPAQQ